MRSKVLIVEDEKHMLRVLSLWLDRHGYEVFEAGNGQEALEKLHEVSVDVIVTDVNMPVIDGLAFIRTVRHELKLDIPIFMLTARCDQDHLTEEIAPLNVHLFPKPFVPSRLVADLDQVLGRNIQAGGRKA